MPGPRSCLFDQPGLKPCDPVRHALAGFRGQPQDFDGGIDAAQVRFIGVKVGVAMGGKVGLRQDGQTRSGKHVGIFQRLVLALGHRKDGHLGILAQIKARRADQISDVFDEQIGCGERAQSSLSGPGQARRALWPFHAAKRAIQYPWRIGLGCQMQGQRIRVRGQVQGVGFRPFIWALAREFALTGRVFNDPEGVLIEVFGPGIADFAAAIPRRAPPLARVDAVDRTGFEGIAPEGFAIAQTQGRVAETGVAPDAATCPDCIAEINGPGRRHGYAFTNCTQCGPHFTILHGLPYDREKTSMAAFAMCPACRAEYEDPAFRRFQAQPIACPDCGPRLWYEVGGVDQGGDPVSLAVDLLRRGGILALKELGGFHLAGDAANPDAVALLRARKQRPAKPFALMGTVEALGATAWLSAADSALLADPAALIVLVGARHVLPEAVAPGLGTLGVMLPHTPLHHLLLAQLGRVLVMTSGNLSGAPQVTDSAEATAKLSACADGFRLHDRALVRGLDDRVERATPPMALRRARGRVPGTWPVPPGFPQAQVLALGGQIKASICLVKSGEALLSHPLGDLDDARTEAEFLRALTDTRALLDHRPDVVAGGLHDGCRSSTVADTMGLAAGLPVVRVPHHHAHLAAGLADNPWPRNGGQVAGLILDGLGLAPDGTLWGGEVLLGDYDSFTRLAHLHPAALG